MSQLIQQTVILGGGFTGLYTALDLRRNNFPDSVILVDKDPCFRFRPLLYEYFSEQMDELQVMPRFEDLLRGSGVHFVQDTVSSIDLEDRQVQLQSGTTCPYSNLVIALGSVTGYFGVEGAKDHAIAFRDGGDAIALDQRIRSCMDLAIQSDVPEHRRQALTFVVIGGGPTGVELSATLADLLPHWYQERGGDSQDVRVVLLNRGPQILRGDVNDPLRDTAEQKLKERAVPVEILKQATATAIRPDAVEYKQGGQDQVITLPASTAIWTAGTATHPLIQALPVRDENRDRKGRLVVTSTQQLPDHPEVFAGGDCAAMAGKSLPPTAQVAHQQGMSIAHNLRALVAGKALAETDVHIRGTLMKLGLEEGAANIYHQAVVDGVVAHLIRQGTYMSLLPNPGHNLQAGLKWFNQGVLQRYLEPTEPETIAKWTAGAVVAAVVARKVVHTLGSDDGP